MKKKEIDWERQWRDFSPNFYNGAAHIDLTDSKQLLLKPGGGFGDLSHPTTRLCLKLMVPFASSVTVVDIGCGSGILMLSALLLGAAKAIGVDIDTAALEHAKANAELNGLNKRALFVKTTTHLKLKEPLLYTMNMISSEQQAAWSSQAALHSHCATIVTSGILAEQKESYLEWTKGLGWELQKMEEEEGWMGFVFLQKNPA